MEQKLSYAESFLQKHGYPMVHAMSPTEIADVFHARNRCLLISWALVLMDKDHELVIKGKENDEELLADLIYCHGFCTDSEKLKFVRGEELCAQRQFDIIYKMFTCIDRIKKAATITLTDPVTVDEVMNFKNLNINLFPSLGKINVAPEEQQRNFEEVQMLIEQLKQDCEDVLEDPVAPKTISDSDKDIKGIISEISNNFSHFSRMVKEIKNEASLQTGANYKVDPTLPEILQRTNKSLKGILQYIEDLRVIKEHAVKDLQIPKNEISSSIEVLAKKIQSLGCNIKH